MGTIALTLPTVGNPNSTEDPLVRTALSTIQTLVNGNVDGDNLSATVGQQLGVSSSTVIRRGKVNIPGTETRVTTSYGLLATPDRVSNVVLPTDGLIFIAYRAIWKSSLADGLSTAAMFIGSNQLKLDSAGINPAVQEVTSPTVANFTALGSYWGGLTSGNSAGDAVEVTTGQIVGANPSSLGGGAALVFAAAGTYDISVQFKAGAAATVSVKNRHLWVSTIGF